MEVASSDKLPVLGLPFGAALGCLKALPLGLECGLRGALLFSQSLGCVSEFATRYMLHPQLLG